MVPKPRLPPSETHQGHKNKLNQGFLLVCFCKHHVFSNKVFVQTWLPCVTDQPNSSLHRQIAGMKVPQAKGSLQGLLQLADSTSWVFCSLRSRFSQHQLTQLGLVSLQGRLAPFPVLPHLLQLTPSPAKALLS